MLRSLVNKGFTAQAVGRLEGELGRRANLLIDAFPVGRFLMSLLISRANCQCSLCVSSSVYRKKIGCSLLI